MKNERFTEEIRELSLELLKRGVPHALAALDLNGAYVVLPRELRLRNEEINLISSIECLTQRCREAENAEITQIFEERYNYDRKHNGSFIHPIGEITRLPI